MVHKLFARSLSVTYMLNSRADLGEKDSHLRHPVFGRRVDLGLKSLQFGPAGVQVGSDGVDKSVV